MVGSNFPLTNVVVSNKTKETIAEKYWVGILLINFNSFKKLTTISVPVVKPAKVAK